jgi:hypothetical protein
VIVRFLSKFGTLEESSANDRPGGVIVRTTEDVTIAAGLNVKLAKKNQFYEN